MSIIKAMKNIFAVLIFIFIAQSVKAQDIVPMRVEYPWPLHSFALDSADFFYAQSIKKNKVKFCIIYSEDRTRGLQTFYDRNGRVTNILYNTNDTVSYEYIYGSNSEGQITESKEIDYQETPAKKIVYEYYKTYEYKNGKPIKYQVKGGGLNFSEEAIYTEGVLTHVIHFFNNDNKKQSKDAVRYEKTEAGTVVKGPKEGDRIFESVGMDSVVIGSWTFVSYKIKNKMVLRESTSGIDYGKEKYYYYKTNGLIDFTEEIYDVPFVSDKTPKRQYYTYYYYED